MTGWRRCPISTAAQVEKLRSACRRSSAGSAGCPSARSCALPDRDRRTRLPGTGAPPDRRSRRAPQPLPCADWPAGAAGSRRSRSTARATFMLPRLRTAFSRTCQNSSAVALISAIGRLRAVGVGAERLGCDLAHHPVLVGQRARDRFGGGLQAARRRARSPRRGEHARPDRRWRTVSAGIDSSSFRKPMTPIACTRTEASASRSASSAGFSASLRRNSFSARSAPCARRRAHARPAAGSRRRWPDPSTRPCCRPRRSPPPARDRPAASPAPLAASGPSNSPSASATCWRTPASGSATIAVEMRHRGRIAGIAELDDRDAALAGIGGVQPLADVVEVVIGSRTARAWHHRSR